ncbi:hypothetical protein Leryth_025838 [Lithospermum erythrorhizon]|nr:hypothetical protein Leryth_025838 [Lithospermum erythrorhizon]
MLLPLAAASMKDFDAVEGVLKKMKSKEIRYDWFTYGNLANIYIDSGLLDKACSIIKEMENKKHLLNEEALQTMIGIHARTKNLSGVYTAWELLKSKCPTQCSTALIMLLTLNFRWGNQKALRNISKNGRQVDPRMLMGERQKFEQRIMLLKSHAVDEFQLFDDIVL